MVPQKSIEMTPENYKNSLRRYAMKPVRIVKATSEIPSSLTKNLKFLKIIVVKMPMMKPTNTDPMTTFKNPKIR